MILGDKYMYEYILKCSNRRTISLEISKDLQIIVRAPFHFSKLQTDYFVENQTAWIEKHMEISKKLNERRPEPTKEQILELKSKAKDVIPPKVAYYSQLMGLKPTHVKITSAKTRYGSCSSKNGICFSYMLMLYSDLAIDYVVVHELAHIKYHNHSELFYTLIEKYMPDYKERNKLLKSGFDTQESIYLHSTN